MHNNKTANATSHSVEANLVRALTLPVDVQIKQIDQALKSAKKFNEQ